MNNITLEEYTEQAYDSLQDIYGIFVVNVFDDLIQSCYFSGKSPEDCAEEIATQYADDESNTFNENIFNENIETDIFKDCPPLDDTNLTDMKVLVE